MVRPCRILPLRFVRSVGKNLFPFRFPPFLHAKKQKQQASDPVVSEQEPAPPDEALLDAEADRNYDGYYDDILPTDLGKKREPVDRSLVIKILLLCAGVFLIISACVVALYLL